MAKPMQKIEHFTLDAKELAYIKRRAPESEFFASLLESYEQYGSATKKQRDIIRERMKDEEEYARRPRLKDANGESGPVNNKVFIDGKPQCFIPKCGRPATLRIDSIGVCADHEDEGHKTNDEWHARNARP